MGGLIGLIFWGCFLFFIIKNVNRSKKPQKHNTADVPNRQVGNEQNWQMSQSTGNGQNRQNAGNRKNPKKTSEQDWLEQRESQAELKRRLQAKYGSQKSGTVQPEKSDILKRAAQNVAEDFEDDKLQTPVREQAETDGGQKQAVTANAVLHPMENIETQPSIAGNIQTELGHSYDFPQNLERMQESELMQMVSDLMAKGVDTSLEFERDFISEGMDMINRMGYI